MKAPCEAILVSACMAGVPCRYDGTAAPCEDLATRAAGRIIVPVCPEQLGGLPTARAKSHLVGGDGIEVTEGRARVSSEEGLDVTENFLRGAQAAVQIAKTAGASSAIMKEGSPSCGVTRVEVDGRTQSGCGVTTAVLRKMGIRIIAF